MDANNDGGFFSSLPIKPIINSNDEGVDLFAQAVARLNNTDKSLLTTHLTPVHSISSGSTPAIASTSSLKSLKLPVPTMSLPRMPIASSSTTRSPSSSGTSSVPSSSSEFTKANSSTLPEILRTPNVLIIDIRPHSAYSSARLPHSISLSVPSTLLKRPAFTLQKLGQMLSSSSSRSRFKEWKKASRILVYDADTSNLQEHSNLFGLLRKFKAEGFAGDLAWLQGGLQALWRDHRHLVETEAISEDEDDGDSAPVLRARDLPSSAFQSTAVHSQPHSLRSSPTQTNVPIPHASSSSLNISFLSNQRAAANPFYDNIRQNIELSQGITERIPLRLSPTTASRVTDLPFAWLRNIAQSAGRDECTEALAMQFYRIELGEQRRLQGIMAHHSMQSGSLDENTVSDDKNKLENTSEVFPYSIIAGVEKGSKNRYRNIWPFEHSRVRLQGHKHDDYVNASFVQPLGTRRRYIATQGPLPSTFIDFWTVVWEQDIRVVLMLTKEHEGGTIKCGRYWTEGQHGPFELKLVMTSGAKEEDDFGGSFFSTKDTSDETCFSNSQRDEDLEKHNHTIRRVFEVSNIEHPEQGVKTVTHLQYLGWPDMDVPVNPKSLLRLICEVDDLIEGVYQKGDAERQPSPCILLHCSAGVGRTGAYIMIDAVLDGIRNEIRKRALAKKAKLEMAAKISSSTTRSSSALDNSSSSHSDGEIEIKRRKGSPNAMDVDSSSDVPSRCQTPPCLTSSKFSNYFPSVVPSNTLTTQKNTPNKFSDHSSYIPPNASGPVATLHMGDRKSGTDIHVPLVPSSVSSQLKTPKQFTKELDSTDSTRVNHQLPQIFSASGPLTFGISSPLDPSGGGNLPIFQRRASSLLSRRSVKNDFTADDAASMFMSPSPNPDFAMDVESLHPSIEFQQQRNAAGSSSSGEGNNSGSGGDKSSAGSIRSGFGSSSSDGKVTGPLRAAFATMSSADDVPGKNVRSDLLNVFRGRVSGDGSGSGSGEGSGRSASGSSGKVSTSSGGGNGGYSSASSIGRGIGALGVSSPGPSSSNPSISGQGGKPARLQQSPRKVIALSAKSGLKAPKPVRPAQASMPDLTEGIESSMPFRPLPSRLSSDMNPQNKVLNRVHPSSSVIEGNETSTSTDNLSSSLFTDTTDTSNTPASLHNFGSQPSALSGGNKDTKKDDSKGKGDKSQVNVKFQSQENNPDHNSAFDYVPPRKLHGEDSPPLLSSLEEPIRQILEDMREQRMSLCQSLRQYVFVHNAIIEGSLLVVDQEKERFGLHGINLAELTPPELEPLLRGGFMSPDSFDKDESSRVGDKQIQTQITTGKRGASPTELLKKDKMGEVALAKRPSVKRGKSTSSGDSTGSS